ncbi:MAG TPA: hypothetical protein VFC68_01980 [Treponemataceae bacterium]|nr:hypothetical protein [Treponemataceae bacterium]
MKKKIAICFLLTGFVCVLFASSTNTRWVSVQKTHLKSRTGWFASKTSAVFYGDEVRILNEKGSWAHIALSIDPRVTGWISSSSLTKKKIALWKSDRVSADAHELSLAGKGFTQEIEDEYKKTNLAGFAAVDAVENIEVDQNELYDFLVAGQLKGCEK